MGVLSGDHRMFQNQPDKRPSPFRLLWQHARGSIVATVLASLVLTLGWELFAARLESRLNRDAVRSDEVRRIWGGPVLQGGPRVQWRRQDAATAELATAPIDRTDIQVGLKVEYRARGLTEYPTYEADFAGVYVVTNPSSASSFVAFRIPLPGDGGDMVSTNLALLVDGKEAPAETQYQRDTKTVLWTGEMEGQQTKTFEFKYRVRGLESFAYDVDDAGADFSGGSDGSDRSDGENGASRASASPQSNFKLAMTVEGLDGELDYPIGSMSPTSIVSDGGRSILTWDLPRVLTSLDAGVLLPDHLGPMRAFVHLLGMAPWFFVLFSLSLGYAFARLSSVGRLLHGLGFAAVYFVHFPLVVYLAAYLPWTVAVVVTLAASVGLLTVHARRFAGGASAVRVLTSAALFLVVPVVAYLVPQHAGLILVATGFICSAILLRLVAMLAQWVDRTHSEAPIMAEVGFSPTAPASVSQPASEADARLA